MPLEEARALEGIGSCLLRFDNIPDGAAHLRQALVIYQRLVSRTPNAWQRHSAAPALPPRCLTDRTG